MVEFIANETTSTSTMVYWNEPSERNGYITSYTVQSYTPGSTYNYTEFSDDVFMYNITTLKPFKSYYIGVFANTSKGAGAIQTQRVDTHPAGKFLLCDLKI